MACTRVYATGSWRDDPRRFQELKEEFQKLGSNTQTSIRLLSQHDEGDFVAVSGFGLLRDAKLIPNKNQLCLFTEAGRGSSQMTVVDTSGKVIHREFADGFPKSGPVSMEKKNAAFQRIRASYGDRIGLIVAIGTFWYMFKEKNCPIHPNLAPIPTKVTTRASNFPMEGFSNLFGECPMIVLRECIVNNVERRVSWGTGIPGTSSFIDLGSGKISIVDPSTGLASNAHDLPLDVKEVAKLLNTMISKHNSGSKSQILPSTRTLKVDIVKAREMPAADVTGKSDPYCKLFYVDPEIRGHEGMENRNIVKAASREAGNMMKDAYTSMTGSFSSTRKPKIKKKKTATRLQFGETSVVQKTLDPEWNESFVLELSSDKDASPEAMLASLFIVIEVWDHDYGTKDDFLGTCRIHTPFVMYGSMTTTFEGWVPLTIPTSATGAVFVKLAWDNHSTRDIKIPESILMRTLFPPVLPLYSKYLYDTVTLSSGLALDLPPASEVVIDMLDKIVFKHEEGTLLLTNFRLCFIAYSSINRAGSGSSTLLAPLVIPIGTIVESSLVDQGLAKSCLRVVCKHNTALDFISSSSLTPHTPQDERARVTQATTAPASEGHNSSTLLRISAEITWRSSEGCFAYSMCDHAHTAMQHKRQDAPSLPRSHAPPELLVQGVSSAITHNVRRLAVVARKPKKPRSSNIDIGKRVLEEYRRQGLLDDPRWTYTTHNHAYKLCETYPRHLMFPKYFPESKLSKAATYRSKERLPACTYLHPRTQAPLCRCSQPKSGLAGRDLREDNELLLAIRASTPKTNPILHIFDARALVAASANAAFKGKGFESVTNLGGDDVACLKFCDIGNIHTMRSSLQTLAKAFSTDFGDSVSDFMACVASSKWLDHLSRVLCSSVEIANTLTAGHPCVVHCSDGWDRTSQLSATSQLLVDPHFRTISGFADLIEKDWCAFGHMFALRCGAHGKHFKEGESSPIFLQWLDCVEQIRRQCPTEFEFGSSLLLYIAQVGLSSEYFGTFLYNSESERHTNDVATDTISLWEYVDSNTHMFSNPLYVPVSTSTGIMLQCEISITGDRMTEPGTPLQFDPKASAIMLWRDLYDGNLEQNHEQRLTQFIQKQRRLIQQLSSSREEVSSARARASLLDLTSGTAYNPPHTHDRDGSDGDRHRLRHRSTQAVSDELDQLKDQLFEQQQTHANVISERNKKPAAKTGANRLQHDQDSGHKKRLTTPATFTATVASFQVATDHKGRRVAFYVIKVAQTLPLQAEWNVTRRFSDFLWLQSQYTNDIHVKLKGKTLFHNFTREFLTKRKELLDDWLQQTFALDQKKHLVHFLDADVDAGLD
eukprot:m.227379 g.227379  ORF g.227379 m.227379 type:complete len:1334 (-) comp33519_c1_seq2:43-4044(-)